MRDEHRPAIIASSGAKIPIAAPPRQPQGQARLTSSGYDDQLTRAARLPHQASFQRLGPARVSPYYLRALAQSNEWVDAAIRRRASQIGGADWSITPINPDQRYSSPLRHRLEQLFRHPNRHHDSFRTLVEPVVRDHYTIGQGCIEKVPNAAGQPVELYALDAARIAFDPDWDGQPRAPRYYYRAPDELAIPLRNDQIVVFLSDPASYRPDGLSKVEVLKNAIDAELAGSRWAANHLKQRPPSGVVYLGDAGEAEVDRFTEKFGTEVAGQSQLAITAGPLAPSFIPFDLQEGSDLLEWQEYFVKKLCAVFLMSPQELGMTMDINKASGAVQKDLSEDAGLKPILALFEEYINREIIGAFGDPWQLNLKFSFTALSDIDRHETAQLAREQIGPGIPWITINEARKEDGKEPIVGGDVLVALTSVGVQAFLGEGIPDLAAQREEAARAAAQAAQSRAGHQPGGEQPAGDGHPAEPAAQRGAPKGLEQVPGRLEPGRDHALPGALPAATRLLSAAQPVVYRADLSTMRQRLRQGYGALAASQQEAVARDARARLHLAALVGPLSAAEIGRALLWALRRNLARRADLAQLIYQEWIESGRAVLAAELRRLGRGDAVRLSHDSYVFARAQQTARGLLETLERDAEALLAGLAPEDSEQALDHFLGWLQRRDQVRERLVAVTETQRAVGYFQQQFVRKNGLEGRARCTPEQAACPACNDYLQRGWVSLDEALGWDLPSHPNCPHELEIDYAPLNETSPLWTGE